MQFLIDTFSWKKIDLIINKNFIKLNDFYHWGDIITTNEVKKEIIYRKFASFDLKHIQEVPIKNRHIFDDAISLNFDEADASILSNGSNDLNGIIIISEDRPLLTVAESYGFIVVQLIDFFFLVLKMGKINRNCVYKINTYLHELTNISDKKYKKIKLRLQMT